MTEEQAGEEMETCEVTFTEEDLSANTMNAFDCPGYRAVKRVIPTLSSWLFRIGPAYDPEKKINVIVTIPEEAEHKLICHSYYQDGDNSDPKYPPVKAEPFSCLITVPKRLLRELPV